MGIDRIGKGAPPPPPPKEVTDSPRATETGRAFEVNKPAPTGQAAPVQATHTALDRLRAGEIDLDRYLDLKVDEATTHLRALPPAQLDAVKRTLRERIATDPTLVDLVRTATGAAPPPPQDE
jgi:hypothetical protein